MNVRHFLSCENQYIIEWEKCQDKNEKSVDYHGRFYMFWMVMAVEEEVLTYLSSIKGISFFLAGKRRVLNTDGL